MPDSAMTPSSSAPPTTVSPFHMKCNCNDFGTGVFGMLRWPKRIPQGQVHDALVSQMDIFPTSVNGWRWTSLDWLQGESLDPLIDNPQHPGRDTVFK